MGDLWPRGWYRSTSSVHSARSRPPPAISSLSGPGSRSGASTGARWLSDLGVGAGTATHARHPPRRKGQDAQSLQPSGTRRRNRSL